MTNGRRCVVVLLSIFEHMFTNKHHSFIRKRVFNLSTNV